jgi:hypothetical protein
MRVSEDLALSLSKGGYESAGSTYQDLTLSLSKGGPLAASPPHPSTGSG